MLLYIIEFSSLSESGFIPTGSIPEKVSRIPVETFSSLSESGFIPTKDLLDMLMEELKSSHLFQRVASFLPESPVYEVSSRNVTFSSLSESGFIPTNNGAPGNLSCLGPFSSLSESGFIPTRYG